MIFIDAGIWIAATSANDEHHQRAAELLRQVEGEKERAVVTESVISEAAGFFARKGLPVRARRTCEEILSVKNLEVLTPSLAEFALAAKYVEKFELSSYTDALTMAVMESRGIRKLLSFDADFDANRKIRRIS